jgi:hypothetical protein
MVHQSLTDLHQKETSLPLVPFVEHHNIACCKHSSHDQQDEHKSKYAKDHHRQRYAMRSVLTECIDDQLFLVLMLLVPQH